MPWLKQYDGVLLVDKPSGLTSHDVVYKLRRILQQREIGHTGTLDPLATGLLVVCLGKATKIAQFISGMHKSYVASIHLGMRSSTYDAEGIDPTSEQGSVPPLTVDRLTEMLAGFVGVRRQRVPAHSAVRMNGQHMYELARQGAHMELPEREIEILSLKLLSYSTPELQVEVSCSKGTYIRTLAHEIGEQLGCGGYLAALRRTEVGPFCIENALTLDQVTALLEAHRMSEQVLPLADVLQFGAVRIRDDFAKAVSHGRTPQWIDVESVEGSFEPGDNMVIKSHGGAVLAVAVAGGSSTGFANKTGHPVESYVRVLA